MDYTGTDTTKCVYRHKEEKMDPTGTNKTKWIYIFKEEKMDPQGQIGQYGSTRKIKHTTDRQKHGLNFQPEPYIEKKRKDGNSRRERIQIR